MMCPDSKKCGDIQISVRSTGYPYWTDVYGRDGFCACLNEEQARDLHYALSRIVAYLDFVERRDQSHEGRGTWTK